MQTHLTAAAYYLGEIEPIESAARTPEDEDAVDTLLAMDMGSYARSSVSVAEMAAASMSLTMERARIAAADVEAVVLATDTPLGAAAADNECLENYRQFRREMFQAMARVGLKHAYPFATGFSRAGNLASAVALASGAVKTQGFTNVMVVVADRIPDSQGRIVLPGVGVLSDGAASCLVTPRAVPGFALEHLLLYSSLSSWELEGGGDLGQLLREMAGALELVGKRMVESSGRPPSDYKWLITNNYSKSNLRIVCHQLGYDSSQLFLDNVSRIGHACAADILINICDLEQNDLVRDGDRAMAIATSPVTWGMMSLAKVV